MKRFFLILICISFFSLSFCQEKELNSKQKIKKTAQEELIQKNSPGFKAFQAKLAMQFVIFGIYTIVMILCALQLGSTPSLLPKASQSSSLSPPELFIVGWCVAFFIIFLKFKAQGYL